MQKAGGKKEIEGYFELDSGEKIPVLDTTFDENKAILHHLETVPATLKKGVSLKAIVAIGNFAIKECRCIVLCTLCVV